MDKWAGFYEKLFNFREVRYFDIEGKLTGLKSPRHDQPGRQDPHPDQRKLRRQIADRGISARLSRRRHPAHRARPANDIYRSVETLAERGVAFQDTPDTYYERLDNRIKGHGEDVPRLKRDRILMDGARDEETGLLLQIFTQNAIGPIFFEIIQRKGNEGFGEGNFKALFESIEADQIKRGVLKDTNAA